ARATNGTRELPHDRRKVRHMKRNAIGALLCLLLLLRPSGSGAFCGFYVASGNAKLFNKSSQVVLVRDRDRTVITMASDYQGDPKEFAVVVPVPTVIKKEQVHIGDPAVIEHLDQYSAPRLVEYWDENPCAARDQATTMFEMSAGARSLKAASVSAGHADGVHI